jgi:hypothetical protein
MTSWHTDNYLEIRRSSGILSISTPNIHGFSLYHTNSGFDGIDDIRGFDNVVFDTVTPVLLAPTIPEPTTLALLTIGIAGVGYSRRRSNSK